jgi:hypothetical protein
MFFLIRVDSQKKLDALITATFSLIGKQKVFSDQQDRKVEIGVISLIDMEYRAFMYSFLFLSVAIVLFILNTHQLRQKCLFYFQINTLLTHSSKHVNARKLLNFV